MKLRRILLGLGGLAAIGSTTGFAQLYSENFDIDHTANWTVNLSAGTHPVDLFFDYNTVGIPSAPNSGGTFRGAKLQANTVGSIFGGVSISPIGQSFVGDYRLRFDLWINYNGRIDGGGNGTTQLAGGGVGTKGNTVQWAGGAQDSVWFAATGDGGSGQDYRAYSSAAGTGYLPASGVYAAGTVTTPTDVRNNSHPYYAGFGNQPAPAAQLALFSQQTNNTFVGTLGFAWHDVAVTKIGNQITWTVDGVTFATVDASALTLSTNILLNYFDSNTASSTDPNAGALLFGLFDNIRVEEVPEPAACTLMVAGLAGYYVARRRRRR